MIVEFSTEFERIATAQGAGYVSKKVSELEDFVQGYDFTNGLINFVTPKRFKSAIGASSQMMYDETGVFQFLTKAVKSDNYEATKAVLIDEMTLLAQGFFRQMNLNESLLFSETNWEIENEYLWQYTSNFLVGIESTLVLKSACNRL